MWFLLTDLLLILLSLKLISLALLKATLTVKRIKTVVPLMATWEQF